MKNSVLSALLCMIVASHAYAFGPWHATDQNTPGWRYMSPNERIEYQRHMRGFNTLEQCRDFQAQHQLRIRERAGQTGVIPEAATESACAQLKARGRLK